MLKKPLHLTLRRAKTIDSMNVNVIDYACLKGKQNGITKDTYSRGSAERVLRSYQTYYNIKTEAVEPPFAAEAIFGSHNEQYFLIKKAKVADIDTNETVYFATEESLSKDRLLELDSIAWERGTANVQPSSNHRNSDVVLIILTGHAEEDALIQVKKCKHYQSYLWGFHGRSNYRLIVAELSSGRIVHNRHGQILKKLVKKAMKN